MTRPKSSTTMNYEDLARHAAMLEKLASIYRDMSEKMKHDQCELKAEMINSGVRGLLQLSVFLAGVHQGYVNLSIKEGLDGIEEAVDLFHRFTRTEARAAGIDDGSKKTAGSSGDSPSESYPTVALKNPAPAKPVTSKKPKLK